MAGKKSSIAPSHPGPTRRRKATRDDLNAVRGLRAAEIPYKLPEPKAMIEAEAVELGPPCDHVNSADDMPFSAAALLRIHFGDDLRRGTGFFIKPGVLLTAGHNTFNGTKANAIDVFPSFNGQDIDTTTYYECKDLAPSPEYIQQQTASNDYGVILLGQDLGVGSYGATVISDAKLAALHIEMVSYPELDLVQRHCTGNVTDNISADDFFYTIRTNDGSSGAPVFLSPANPTIVGIHVRGGSSDGNHGTRITQKKMNQINRWLSKGT